MKIKVTTESKLISLIIHELLGGGYILEATIINSLTSTGRTHSHSCLLKKMVVLPLRVHEGMDTTAHLGHC